MEEQLTNAENTETTEAPQTPEVAPVPEDKSKWYVLHTYSGYENMVRENLGMVFEKNNMLDRLVKIVIPMEDVVEEKNGKRKIVQRRMFPCYVFIQMVYDNSMWHMITNTRGVTGFVGPQGRPLPLTDAEVERMHLREPMSFKTDYQVGDHVKVTQGPLADFVGVVKSVDAHAGKCQVVVSMFGRETPVELEFSQIKRAE